MAVPKIFTRCFIVTVLLCHSLFAMAGGSRPSVTFLAPDDSRFWNLVSGFMSAVANDLDMDLEVLVDTKRHRFSYLKLAREALNRPEKPDYLVFMCKEDVTEQMLTLANAAGVKVFTFNTEVPRDSSKLVGLPRGNLANWLGHLSADNKAAGRTLAQLLEKQARLQGLAEADNPVPMIALSGTLDSSASKDRSEGLQAAADERVVKLSQMVAADWSAEEAAYKARILLKRYPDTQSIWSASDGMALGAIDAAKLIGRAPGQDLLVGGVDWQPEALQAIRRGDLAVSMGRHFMEGGLLMILLHDYHHGQDFASGMEDSVMRYELDAVTRANVDQVAELLDPNNWQRVDFARFSRADGHNQSDRWSSADQLLDAFTEALLGSDLRDPMAFNAESLATGS